MALLGELEQLMGRIYPYRWPIAIVGLLALAGVVAVGHRSGWHRTVGRHRRAATIATVAVLAVALPVGWFLLSPLWTRTELSEASPLEVVPPAGVPAESGGTPPVAPSFQPRVVRSGAFRGADSFHFGEGQAQLIESAPGRYVVRFEGFSVRNGPDLHVYLSPDPAGYTDDALDLGALKATDGTFNHDVPAGTDPSRFASVLVWCEPFEVLFAVAPLDPV